MLSHVREVCAVLGKGDSAIVVIPGIHVLMGYFRYCGFFVLQPQCVACSVAGVIS